ncbi:hypothetical protein AHiyo6_01210 [Arthrobacter sp. Hiyo6]|nr:hypothetical protein AHiyo6_01210 [Arthrobacter sp. Hiyo6]
MEIYSEDYLRGRTIAELHEMKRSSEQIMKARRRERDKLSWSNSDRESHDEVIDNNFRAISMIHRELDRQHAERNAARERREASQSGGTAEAAIGAWFKRNSLEAPYRLNLNWFVDDRQYMGSYRPRQGDLEVFLVVAPDTPAPSKGPARPSYLQIRRRSFKLHYALMRHPSGPITVGAKALSHRRYPGR